MSGRLLAIGDIHGCSQALDALLALVQPAAEDQIVVLGDYVDRGPDSKGVLDRMVALHEKGSLIALRGNHDWMMLDARKAELRRRASSSLMQWFACGGEETLASYRGSLLNVPPAHWDFLEQHCIDWYEAEKHFFVHADVEPGLALADQPLTVLHWQKLEHHSPHMSGKVMICGHTQQRSGKPLDLGYAICIDTWAYGEGWLTALDVHSRQVWQANQQGETRAGTLDELA